MAPQLFSCRFAFALFATLALLSPVVLPGANAASVPAGTSFVTFTFQVTSGSYSQSEVINAVASWRAVNSMASVTPTINSIYVSVYDYLPPGASHSLNIAVEGHSAVTIDVAYPALLALRVAMLAQGVLPSPKYNVLTGVDDENPLLTVTMDTETFGSVYLNKWSRAYRIYLDVPPRYGSYVDINIAPVFGTVTTNATTVRINWPHRIAGFLFKGSAVLQSAAVFTAAGPDIVGRTYLQSVTTPFNRITILALETAVRTRPSVNARVYANTVSPSFYLTAPSHLNTNIDLVVYVYSKPANLTFLPSRNVTLTTKGANFPFSVSGPAGVYRIFYYINPTPWITGGAFYGTSNDEFNQMATIDTFHIRPKLNITVNSIPDAYILAAYYSTAYGGAFSLPIAVTLQSDPNSDVTITPTPQTGLTFTPAALLFSIGGTRIQTFTIRAQSSGIMSIGFAVSGASKDDYKTPIAPKRWVVYPKNLKCLGTTPAATCFSTSGCVWNQAKSVCSNTSLPIALPKLPLLFNLETTVPLTFFLPTPIQPNSPLTITFQADARLSFSPPTLTLQPGATNGTFQLTGTLSFGDSDVVSQSFQLLLSGNNAGYYKQVTAVARLRPRVECELTNAYGFFVLTTSEWFEIACDTDPESDVYFLPQTSTGVEFFPEGWNSSWATLGRLRAVYMKPGQFTGRFFANSTLPRTGAFALSIVIGGTNRLRYEPIADSTFRVLPAGLVLLPPTFYMTQHTTTPMYNVDLSVASSKSMWITIRAELNSTNATSNYTNANVTVHPTKMWFNDTQRGSFNVTANGTGWYYLRFELLGENIRNYEPITKRVAFFVQDPLDGPAFEARRRRGYLNYRKQCRVAVGLRSVRFDGQDPNTLRSEFCGDIPRPWSNITYNCAPLNLERCRATLEELGHACVWNRTSCIFLPEMQGNILSAQFGSGFTVILATTGQVFTIGESRYGQLGHLNATGLGMVPLPETIATIAVGNNHALALSYEGRVYTWGVNSKGQLGQNTRQSATVTPGLVPFPRGENISCISSGVLHAAALSLSGRLFTWGSNEYGQLGFSGSLRSFVNAPRLVSREYVEGDAITAVQCGEYHTMIATDNNAYTFGMNAMGQLGRVGFDEWKPKTPVLWVQNKYNKPPNYQGYWVGKQC